MATIKLKFRPSTVRGKEGTLFFQIIHLRQVRQIYTDHHLYSEEWDLANSSVFIPSTADAQRETYLLSTKEFLRRSMARLLAIISQLDDRGFPYTAQDVVTAFNAPIAVMGVVSFTRKLIEDMKKIGKRSTVKRFGATINSLLRYTGGDEVAWMDISSTFILGYEEFLIKRGLCRNSTSFYMRNLRAIINRAFEQDFQVPRNIFNHVYMGVDKTMKRAVSLDIVRMIRDCDLTRHPSLDFARNVFMFAFYTRGMAFVDIAFLKKSDLHNGVIRYSRRKTRQQVMVKMEPETKEIINSFKKSETSFLLPIITDEGGNLDRQYENAYYRVNRNIQKVGKMIGLETKLTLYVARHAWASIAHANNVAVSTISKAMGHDSEKTTIIYLQSLDSSSVDKANSDIIKLIDRVKVK